MAIFSFNGQDLKRLLAGGCHYLNSNRTQLNDLNIFPVPDGDTGTNMVLTMRGAISFLRNNLGSNGDLYYAARLVAQGAIRSAHGNSGVILSQIFNGLAQGLSGKREAKAQDLSLALGRACELAYKAVQNPLEGTILSIIRSCAQFSSEQDYSVPKDLGKFFRQIVDVSLRTLLETDPVDAGGLGLLYIFAGMLAVMEGKNFTAKRINTYLNLDPLQMDKLAWQDFPYRFCTEFLLNDNSLDSEFIKQEIVPYGDSIVIAQDENFTKIHIHTNVPLVLQKFFSRLNPSCQYKIEDMYRQRLHRLPKNISPSDNVKELSNLHLLTDLNLDNYLWENIEVDKLEQLLLKVKDKKELLLVVGSLCETSLVEDIIDKIMKVESKLVIKFFWQGGKEGMISFSIR